MYIYVFVDFPLNYQIKQSAFIQYTHQQSEYTAIR